MEMLQITPVDYELAEKGVEKKYFNVTLKIARMKGAKYLKAIEKHAEGQNLSELSDEEAEDITRRAIADVVLVGWSGMKDKDGKEIKYSKENAYALLKGDEDCTEFIIATARSMDTYLDMKRTDLLGK